MPNLGEAGNYLGQLFNKAFSGLRSGVERAGATVQGALDVAAGGRTRPATVSPLPDSYTPEVAQREMQAQGQRQEQTGRLLDVYRNQLGTANPARNDITSYYPILNHLSDLQSRERTSNRPGLSDLLALIALEESTGGRATNNVFGVMPGGESRGPASFSSIPEAIDYQVGPNVLGGGAGGKLNLLDRTGEITPEEILALFSSYDPHGAYIKRLLENYNYIRGGGE